MQKNIIRLALLTAAILMIPVLGMRFGNGWDWSLLDFVFAGVLIFGTGLAYLLISKKASNAQYRVAIGLALITTFVLVWINGAVGIIGDSDANMLYAGVVFTLFIGTIIARFKPSAMAFTLYVAALVQFLVPIIALIIKTPDFAPGVTKVFVLNGVFVMLYVGSGLLFQQASKLGSKPSQPTAN